MEALNVANIDLHSLCRDDHKMVRRRLASILKEPGDIDDVIQDAYLRLMEVNTRDEKILTPPLSCIAGASISLWIASALFSVAIACS